jgi:uncharacterized protein
MLIRFRVRNFRSLRDEQELSMVASLRDDGRGAVHVETLGVDLLQVAGIYGANAAGKSNVLDALRFLQTAVTSSHRQWRPEGPIPHDPFVLDPAWRSRPSRFAIDFLLDGLHFQYGFELNAEVVLREWLYAFPNKRRQTWFTRDKQEFTFGRSLKGANRTIQGLTRRNSLFLSAAAENNHPSLSPVYRRLAGGLLFTKRDDENARLVSLTRKLASGGQDRKSIVDLLSLADFGIVDVRTKGGAIDLAVKELVNNLSFQIGPWEKNRNLLAQLDFYHRSKGDPVPLSIEHESLGTLAWLSLIGPIISALNRGAVLCIDELDSSLHPLLATEAIKIFESPAKNKNRAQLIFNTHDTALLGNLLRHPSLRRDQIWFVEKDEEGATKLYPLTDFKPRNLENLERGYLQGRYGAIPFIEPAAVGEDA